MRRTALVLFLLAVAVTAGILTFAGPATNAPSTDTELQMSAVQGEELGDSARFPFPIPPSTCGGNVCGAGQYCCNVSCGTCVNFGDYCTQQICNPTE